MAIKETLLGLIFVFVISLFLLQFSTDFISLTNPTSPLVNGSSLYNGRQYAITQYATNLNRTLSEFDVLSVSQTNTLNSTQPDTIQYTFLFARQLFDIPISMFSFFVLSIGNYAAFISTIWQQTLIGGAISLVISILIGGLVITSIIYAIQFIRTGQGTSR